MQKESLLFFHVVAHQVYFQCSSAVQLGLAIDTSTEGASVGAGALG